MTPCACWLALDNAPAIHLYEETGFIAVGETDAYDEHWLQMERLLTA